MRELYIDIAVGATMAMAIYTDVRYHKIYNKLTMPSILLGLIMNAWARGGLGLLRSFEGLMAAFIVVIILFAFKAFGGGDAKLLLAVGALKGTPFILWTILFTIFAAGLLALIVVLRKGIFKFTMKNLGKNLYQSFIVRSPLNLAAGSRGGKLPYSLAVAAGTLAAMLWLG